MRERPILMSAPMVRATLDGSKTQTRRVASKLVRHPDLGNRYMPGALVLEGEPQHVIERACPYGRPGDRLWVREAWRTARSLDHLSPQAIADRCLDAGYRKPWAPLLYDADGHRNSEWRGFGPHPGAAEPGKGRPSIHMPRWASRISLEITSVRVERLQDISDTDAVAEGIGLNPSAVGVSMTFPPGESACHAGFRALWESINGPESWAANPWVWVVDFRRIIP